MVALVDQAPVSLKPKRRPILCVHDNLLKTRTVPQNRVGVFERPVADFREI